MAGEATEVASVLPLKAAPTVPLLATAETRRTRARSVSSWVIAPPWRTSRLLTSTPPLVGVTTSA